MKRRVMKELRGCTVAAIDGDIGAVRDVYFDEVSCKVRYVVVDTGKWLSGRRVLLAPPSLELLPERLAARLERSEVEAAPDISEVMPASRLYEEARARQVGNPAHWAEPYSWGLGPMAGVPALEDPEDAARRQHESARLEAQAASSTLRSCEAVTGYRIRAVDGLVGRVEDFVLDAATWRIDEILVDTNDWLPGGKVLVSPLVLAGIDWHAREMRVALTREALRNAPEADSVAELRARPGPPPRRPGFRTDMDFRDET